MNIEFIRAHCLNLPHATEQVQWGDDLVFKIAGKMFAGAPLSPARIALSFKSTPEEFAELVERPGVIPAPYMARAYWVALETHDALPPAEIKLRLTRSYELVFAKLPKRTQLELSRKMPTLRTAHNGPPTASCAPPKPARTGRAASATRK
jgi:predicted DNA-binding protein (MmcQ/YjbR family)